MEKHDVSSSEEFAFRKPGSMVNTARQVFYMIGRKTMMMMQDVARVLKIAVLLYSAKDMYSILRLYGTEESPNR